MGALTASQQALLAIIAVAFTAILSNRIRPDIIAVLVLLALGVSGILTPEQALAGFSRPAVITLVGLFVVTEALEQTGVVQWLADRLAAVGGTNETRLIAVFMLAGAALSLVMNNVAAGAVLLPAAVRVAQRANMRASKLLIPLSFGTLVGGMATFFTTANIVLSGNLQAQGQRALTMLDFLPLGGLMVVTGTTYMLLIGRHLLPNRESATHALRVRPDLTQTYQLAERLWEVRIQPDSPLVGQMVVQSAIGEQLGVTVVGVWNGQRARIPPAPDDVLQSNDILLVLGREERVTQLTAFHTTLGRNGHAAPGIDELAVHLTEVVIGPRAPVIGQTVRAVRFRSKYGLTAVALWRNGRSYRTDVGTFALEAGDALLMVGSPERVRQLAREPGYIVLDEPESAPPARPTKARWATVITALAIILSAVGIVPTAEAMLAAAAALIIVGCLSADEAYRAIEWRAIVLIAGMLPLGTALTATGLAPLIGNLFTSSFAAAGPLPLIAALYLGTMLITQFVGGQVAALIVGPIAVTAAITTGVNPPAVAVAVAMACSAAFLTPISHPVNVLMMGPGGYTFGDFARVGIGMTLVCFLTLLLGMPLFWKL